MPSPWSRALCPLALALSLSNCSNAPRAPEVVTQIKVERQFPPPSLLERCPAVSYPAPDALTDAGWQDAIVDLILALIERNDCMDGRQDAVRAWSVAP